MMFYGHLYHSKKNTSSLAHLPSSRSCHDGVKNEGEGPNFPSMFFISGQHKRESKNELAVDTHAYLIFFLSCSHVVTARFNVCAA